MTPDAHARASMPDRGLSGGLVWDALVALVFTDSVLLSSSWPRSRVVSAGSEIHLNGFNDVVVSRSESPVAAVDDLIDAFRDLFRDAHRDPVPASPQLRRRLTSPVVYHCNIDAIHVQYPHKWPCI